MSKIILVFFLFYFSLESKAQDLKDVELYDLLLLFTPINQNEINDWFAGAEIDTPIEWKTEGIEFMDDDDPNIIYGAFKREGNAIITINGEPLYILNKVREKLEWNVNIFGPRGGIITLTLSNNLLSFQNCYSDCIVSYFTERNAKIKLIGCETPYLDNGKNLYEINLNNRSTIYMTEEYSCGSAGCSVDYVFYFLIPSEKYFKDMGISRSNCN